MGTDVVLIQSFLWLSPADDGPYAKAGRDVGGDVALACRRQSIPGKELPLLPSRCSGPCGSHSMGPATHHPVISEQSLGLSGPPLGSR
jgi:hypothetical protein